MLIAFYFGQLGEVTFNYYNNTLFNRVEMLRDRGIVALYDCSLHQYLKLTDNKNLIEKIAGLFASEKLKA